jgi:Flp pilus assembly protein TadD
MGRASAILCLALTATVSACAGVPMPGQMAPGQVAVDSANGEQAEQRQDKEKPGEHLLQIASDVEARGDKEGALEFYERAAMLSDNPAVRAKLGDAYLRAGRADDAASAYHAVLEKEPENGNALMGMGGALLQGGKLLEAHDALVKAAPIVNTAIAYNRLGVVRVMLGRIGDALASFERAHEIDANDTDITTNLALAAVVSGNHERAIGVMRDLTEAQPTKPQHTRNLVLVMAIAGRGQDALDTVRGISAAEMKALLAKAEKVRGQATPKARAAALATASRETAAQ